MGYGRYGNPTWHALEQRSAPWREAGPSPSAAAWLRSTPSLNCCRRTSAWCCPRTAISGWRPPPANAPRSWEAPSGGSTCRHRGDLESRGGADLVWLETPTNPTIEVADLPAVSAGLNGVPLAVDNTFASPLLQQPLAVGADLVIHSATKLLSGHSDALLGAVVVANHDTVVSTPCPPPGGCTARSQARWRPIWCSAGSGRSPVRLAQAQQNAGILPNDWLLTPRSNSSVTRLAR